MRFRDRLIRHLEDWLPVYVVVPILLWIFIGYSNVKERKLEECEARGGVLVETRAEFLCIDPKAFK